jgi:hypothetical protein
MALEAHSVFDPVIILPAIGESFIKLNPACPTSVEKVDLSSTPSNLE